jgi:hypothetical protein
LKLNGFPREMSLGRQAGETHEGLAMRLPFSRTPMHVDPPFHPLTWTPPRSHALKRILTAFSTAYINKGRMTRLSATITIQC